MLALTSSFRDLVALWLADLERQDLVEGTKVNYRDDLRLLIMPAFEHPRWARSRPDELNGFSSPKLRCHTRERSTPGPC